ncbi:hypothetical protein C8Q80DRAFT_1271502 [Daedaleopsis nitida]|nr:hypothetical protein C8Q80DRAFT_1271502 [Daedaleopsis nitida]
MPYVRSRKFCCCLPVRFGVFCEGLLGLGLGGFIAIAGWLEIAAMMKGQLELNQSEKISLWFVAISMTIFALASTMGIVGSIGRMRTLIGVYATTITTMTIMSIISGIYLIFNLFHGETDAQIKKCEDDVANGTANEQEFTQWACSASFKTGRVIVVVLYVIFWLVEICAYDSLSRISSMADEGFLPPDGCVIAYEYLGQLREEADAEARDAEKNQVAKVQIFATPQYAFATPHNAYAPAPAPGYQQ